MTRVARRETIGGRCDHSTRRHATNEARVDCVDRIVLNAYHQFADSPGALRTWWRLLYGSDANLGNTRFWVPV